MESVPLGDALAPIPEAVFRAYDTGQDSQLEADALRLGAPTFLNADEARLSAAAALGVARREFRMPRCKWPR